MRNLLLAYLDAGSGSLILQMIIGGLAGLTALVRFKWHSIKNRGATRVTDDSDEVANPST